MESAIPCALLLLCGLCIHGSFCQMPDYQHPQALPCFVSCVCDNVGLITCNASLPFQQRVFEFNRFLLNFGAGHNSLVHIHTKEPFLPGFLIRLPVVHYLSLAGNNISEIQTGILQKTRLLELNLSHNAIQKIQPGAFRGLTYLRKLDLSYNSLMLISRLVFSDLPFLEVLNLDFNHLLFFPFDAFSKVPRLQMLMLNENSLSYLTPGSLASLSSVLDLGLRNNKLWSFTVDVLDEMPSLKVLDISGNPFHCTCALEGLKGVISSKTVRLKDSSQTTCFRPLSLSGKQISDVVLHVDNCSAPLSMFEFESHTVKYTADLQITCDIQGDPNPAMLWITPWGHQFADQSHWSQLENSCHSCKQQRRYKGIGIDLVSTVSVLNGGNTLHITHFRSFFNGNITCQAFNFLGNDTATHQVEVFVGISGCVRRSMMIGGFCAAGFLCLGLIVGSIKLMVLACKKRFGKKKRVVLTPAPADSCSEETLSHTEDTQCNDSVDFSDEFYPPETPFTTPIAVSPTVSPRKIHTPESGQESPPGGWLHANIMETMEEVRWRLRYGMGRKMETMKRNVQSIKETSIRNVQSIKESGSVYVHNIMESGSTAAHRVKAGVVLGMETVKYHVQSIKEFCGTGDMGTQTISMISVETNLDTNETREVVKSVTIV